MRFHALQTRESGRQRFVSMHVLVPGAWSVQRGHDLLETVEADIRHALPDTIVSTHLEPIEDPRAWEDQPPGGVTIPDDDALERQLTRTCEARRHPTPDPAARRAACYRRGHASTKSPRDFFRPLAVGAPAP